MIYILSVCKLLLFSLLILPLLSCGNGMSQYSDDDLRAKIQGCDYAVDLSTVDLQVCENYHKECKRRLESEGRFVCN